MAQKLKLRKAISMPYTISHCKTKTNLSGLRMPDNILLRQRRLFYSDPGLYPWSPDLIPDRSRAVCFTGHRKLKNANPELRSELRVLLEQLYKLGYRDFINGGAIGFDMLAAQVVIELRNKYPDMRLIMALPCPDQCHPWNDWNYEMYQRILYLCNVKVTLSPCFTNKCMLERNRFMVNHSSLCIAFYTHEGRSGTAATVRYAHRKQVPVFNLADPESYRGPRKADQPAWQPSFLD